MAVTTQRNRISFIGCYVRSHSILTSKNQTKKKHESHHRDAYIEKSSCALWLQAKNHPSWWMGKKAAHFCRFQFNIVLSQRIYRAVFYLFCTFFRLRFVLHLRLNVFGL